MKKNNIMVTVIISVIFLGIGVLLGTQVSKKDKPINNTAEIASVPLAYINGLTSGSPEKAYELSSEVLKGRNSIEVIREISKTVKSDKAEIVNPELYINSEADSNSAIYFANVKNLPKSAMGRTEAAFVIRLVKEDGVWKVDSSQVY